MDYNELDSLYFATFGDSFPTMSFMNDSEEELMKKMQLCITAGVSAVEMYDLSNDEVY